MQTNKIVYLSPKDVAYTFNGQNLHELRRAQLRKIANALQVDSPHATHNELLKEIIHSLDTLQAPAEITELHSQKKPEEKPAEKPTRKKSKKKAKKK